VIPLQLYSSMTAALEGGKWSAARPGRILLPGKTRHPFHRRLYVPQGRSRRVENFVLSGIRSRTVQPVISRYTDWATWPVVVVVVVVVVVAVVLVNHRETYWKIITRKCKKNVLETLRCIWKYDCCVGGE